MPVVTLLLVAAGCQPLPQPFAHPEKSINPVVTPATEFGGITILPISGLSSEKERGLSAALSAALLSQGIIAGPDSSNQRSKFLQGAVISSATEGGRTSITVVWDLFEGNGKFLGSRETALKLPENFGRKLGRGALQRLLKDAAADIAGLVSGTIDQPTKISRISLHVGDVKGAPDRATVPLRRAMKAALKKRDFHIADAVGGDGLVIVAVIEFGPEQTEPRPIRIVWSVRDRDGAELGKLTQQNAIPRRELESRWQTLAAVIADNAADGVSDLVVQLPRYALRNGKNPGK
jgi:hypothetical protein